MLETKGVDPWSGTDFPPSPDGLGIADRQAQPIAVPICVREPGVQMDQTKMCLTGSSPALCSYLSLILETKLSIQPTAVSFSPTKWLTLTPIIPVDVAPIHEMFQVTRSGALPIPS
jgi:hypothetical protein